MSCSRNNHKRRDYEFNKEVREQKGVDKEEWV